MRHTAHYLVIALALLFIFLLNIFLVDDSCIQSPADLAFIHDKKLTTLGVRPDGSFHIDFRTDIHGSEDIWVTRNKNVGPNAKAPFKFRILGNQIALQTRHIFGNADGVSFYRSYIVWSFIFLLSALMVIYRFAVLYFQPKLILYSVLLIMATPSCMYMFKFPNGVMPSDCLGCLFIAVGLYLIARNELRLSIAVVSLGMLCRETVLAVPLFGYFYLRTRLLNRLIAILIPAIVWLAFRYYYSGNATLIGYDALNAIYGNLIPYVQTLSFVFVIYGAMWLFLILGFCISLNSHFDVETNRIVNCSFITLLVILGFHLCLASLWETRVTFLTFAPFCVIVIANALNGIQQVKSLSRYWLVYVISVMAIGLVTYIKINSSLTKYDYLDANGWLNIFGFGIPAYQTRYTSLVADHMITHGWIGIAIFHLTCLAILAPICVMAVKRANRFTPLPETEKLEMQIR